jgi:hypothetical protein
MMLLRFLSLSTLFLMHFANAFSATRGPRARYTTLIMASNSNEMVSDDDKCSTEKPT